MPNQGDRIGDYEVLSELGAGGFGSVWLARDVRDGAEVALKVLHPNLVDCRVGNRGPTIAERFLAEARILQSLDHPGCVEIKGVLDYAEHGVVAYAMERLVGEDLSDCENSFDLATLLKVYAKASDVLAFLHENDVIHRDVKAANIFITDPNVGPDARRRVKLLDFGVAKEMHANAVLANTATGTFLGSVASMPPESFTRWDPNNMAALTGAIDQWSLGVTLYHTLTGDQPFRDQTMVGLIQKIERAPPVPMKIAERFGLTEVPSVVEAIVLRCLAKRPEERFPDMRIVARALREAGRVDYQENATICDPDLMDPEMLDLSEELSDALEGLDGLADPASMPAGPKSDISGLIRPPIDLPGSDVGDATLHQPFFDADGANSSIDTVPPVPAGLLATGHSDTLPPPPAAVAAGGGNDTILTPLASAFDGSAFTPNAPSQPMLVRPIGTSTPAPSVGGHDTTLTPAIGPDLFEALDDQGETPAGAASFAGGRDPTFVRPQSSPLQEEPIDDSTVVDDSALDPSTLDRVQAATKECDATAPMPIPNPIPNRIPGMTTGGGMVQPVKVTGARPVERPQQSAGTVIRNYVRAPVRESPPPRAADRATSAAQPHTPLPRQLAEPLPWNQTRAGPVPSPQVSEIETTAADLGSSLKWYVVTGLVLAVIIGFLIGWLVRANG